MSCELNKVISIINEVANGTKNPVAIKELNELKSDLTQFSVSMQSINEVKDVSKLLDTLTRVSKSTGNTRTKDTPVLNSLPGYVIGQRNMTYAGVGSRETPPEILAEMTKIAQELATKKYSLQSGGAIGADMAFEGKSYPKVLKAGNADVVNKSGKVVLKANTEVRIGTKEYTDAYYVFTDRTNNGRVTGLDFTKAESIKGTKSYSAFDVKDRDVDKRAMAIAEELHPKFENLKSDFAKKLMARNNFQVFGSNLDKPVDFVLFYAKESKNPLRPEGGTGQAVEAARRKGIPTINMSEEGWRDRLNDVLDGKVQDTTSNKTSVQLGDRIEKAREVKKFVSTGNSEKSIKSRKNKEKIAEDIKKDSLSMLIKATESSKVSMLNVSTYYEGIQNVVKSILPVNIVTDDEIAFTNITIRELLSDKPLSYVSGLVPNRSTVVISSGKVDDGTIDRFTEDWFLEGTEEGKRMATLDTDVLYEELNSSGEFSVFKSKNRAEVASRLINVIKDMNGPHTLTHELIHIGSAAFMRENPEHAATKKILGLYAEALENKEVIIANSGQEYWTTNVDEFIAEALSNPMLMQELNKTTTKYGNNRLSKLFKELVNTLLVIVGFSPNDKVYQHVLDGFTAMLEYEYNTNSNGKNSSKEVVSTNMVSSTIAIKAQGC